MDNSIQEKIGEGEKLFTSGKIKEAEECFQELVKMDPENAEVLNDLGVISHIRGDLDKSEDYLLKALAIKEDYLDALNNLGDLYLTANRFNEAFSQFEKCMSIGNQDPISFFNQLGKVYLDKGKFKKAQAVFERSLELNPDQETERVLLGNLEYLRNRAPAKSEVSLSSHQESKKVDSVAKNHNRKMRIAFLTKPGLDQFLNQIVDYFSGICEVKKVIVTRSEHILEVLNWADICWFEWCDDLLVYASQIEASQGKRIVCRLHSYEAFTPYIQKVNWERVNHTIFVAPHIAEIVLKQVRRLDRRNTSVVPNGVDLEKFCLKTGKPGHNLAYVGYVNYKKGPMLLLHAFRELVQIDDQYRLFIAGVFQDARYDLYFGQMIKEMGLGKNVELCGWVDDVPTWLEDKQYIICSSVLEGHPVGIMEAMARGIKPLIHNYVGAKASYPDKYLWNTIPEFVRKVREDDYDSLEYREFIEQNYSLGTQLKNIESILTQSMESKTITSTDTKTFDSASNQTKDERTPIYGDVTAIIAVRNGSKTIQNTLDSLLSQTLPLKKIIVADDCSSDDTSEKVEDYIAKSDGRIELLKLPYNHWIFKARNVATKKVETEYFFFLDSDDKVAPTYVEKLIGVLRANPECAFAYSDTVYFNEKQQKKISIPEFDTVLLKERNYISYSSMMRYSAFKAVGGYSNYLNDCRNHLTEWDLWLRFVGAGKIGKHYPEPLFYYHQDAEQMSKNYERTRLDMHLQMIITLGGTVNFKPASADRILLVCQGKDYLDPTKVSFEVYTWLKPLAKFGEVFTFFYDVESQYFGQDGMIKRLLSLIDQIQPTYIFHPAYKEHISIDCWKEISKRFMTIVWFSDDNWRFDTYSKFYCQGFRFAITTYPEIFERYKEAGYSNILLSQWAANTEYFKDYGLSKNIDVSFAGQNYGDRAVILDGLNVQCFGRGWPMGMLDFPEMAKVLNRSKISVNFSKGANGESQMKCRPFEITASNTLLLCEDTERLQHYYKKDEEVVAFGNEDDLREKIKYYLSHEEQRKRIAKAGYERTLKEHTWQNRFEEIFRAINCFNGVSKTKHVDESIYDDHFYTNHLKYKDLYFFIGDIILSELKPKSVIDWGCGCAFLIEKLKSSGLSKILGIEGSEKAMAHWAECLHDHVILANILEYKTSEKYDLAICMEVAEHMPVEHSDLLVKNITDSSDKYIWWTAAIPGQKGEEHINCQPLSYWEAKMRQFGFEVDWELTYKIKLKMITYPKLALGYYWFRDNLIILRKHPI